MGGPYYRSMRNGVVVTGGSGFIGSAFIRTCLSGKEVFNLDADTYAADIRRVDGTGAQHIPIDVTDPSLAEVFRDISPRIVFHFAAETHVTRSEEDPGLFFRTNVEGTRNVLAAAVTAGVERVVHISTDEVYGPALDRPFTEDDKEPGEGAATSAYARSKALADDLALATEDVQVVVVRPTNCFGPWQHPEKAIPRWVTRALDGRPVPVWGDGLYVRDWMYVDDACSAISTVAERGLPGTVYNVGPQGEATTNIEIAREVARAATGSDELVYLTSYDRPSHDRRYSVDASKLRELGWKTSASLEQRLEETVAWYREHEHWWVPLAEAAEAIYADEMERETT